MILLTLLIGLAQAQDDAAINQRLLGVEPPAQMVEEPVVDGAAVETTASAAPAAAVVSTTPNLPAPAPEPAATSAVANPMDLGWLWSFGGPLGLLVLAAGGAWYVRKNGLKIPGMSGNGLANFQDGPQVVVRSRTPLAGQDVLAVVEITGVANPRRLLVAGGPGGSRLLSDLSAVPTDESSTSDAITRAVQTALAGAWAAPQHAPVHAMPMPAHPAPVVPVMPAPPQPVVAAAAPVAANPSGAMQARQTAAQPAATPMPAPPQATVEIVPVQMPDEAAANEEIDEGPDASRQGGQAFEAELANELDEVQLSRARRNRSRRDIVQDDAPARPRSNGRSDWRSAAYLARDEAPIAEIGDGRPARDTRRPARARRMEDRKSRRRELERTNNSRGHLEALTRGGGPEVGQRFANRRGGGVVRDSASRKERTEAARALLEQVMARRARDDR